MISLDHADDDKEEFNIAASKNLSHLFEDDITTSQTIEQSKSSLFYKPKQNKKPEPDPPAPLTTKSRSASLTPGKLNAFCATAVDVYKLDSGKYTYIAKLGIALMGNDVDSSYRIILYTAKNQPVCAATITEHFQFICQANNYCTFYDDARQNWSILFSNSTDVLTFSRNIAHALFGIKNSKNSNSSATIIQNLGQVANDSIPELTNHVLGFSLKLFVFGLNESLFENGNKPLLEQTVAGKRFSKESSNSTLLQLFSGMSPGNSRYLVASIGTFSELLALFANQTQLPELSKYWKIALEVVLDSIVTGEEWDASQVKTHEKESEDTEPTSEAPSAPVPVPRKSTASSSSPADLATRMAKMGALPIFPIAQQQGTKVEAEPKEVPVLSPKPESTELKEAEVSPKPDPKDPSCHQLEASQFNQLHSELLEIKSLLLSQKQQSQAVPATSSTLTMDSTILLNSITKIIEENGTLKTELTERSKDLERLNAKLLEIAQTRSPDKSPDAVDPTEVEKLKTEVSKLKEEVTTLKESKYQLSMENVTLEKRLLEAEKDLSQSTHRLAAASKSFKTSLKGTLNLVYQEFTSNYEAASKDTEVVDVTAILGAVLLRVKKQQELRVVEQLAGDNSRSSHSRRSSVASSVVDETVNVIESEEN